MFRRAAAGVAGLAFLAGLLVLPVTPAAAATSSVSWSGFTSTLDASLSGGALSYSISTTGPGDTGNSFRMLGRCASSYVTTTTIVSGSSWQTQPSYGGPKTGTYSAAQITTLCGAGVSLTAVRVDFGTSPNYSTASVEVTLAPPPASSCASTSFKNPRAAYVGTTLTVMFGWSGSTVPAGGWKVWAPGNGYTDPASTATLAVPRNRASGNADFEASATIASGITGGSTTARISSADTPTCYVVVTVGWVALVNGVASTGSDPTTGEACSTWDLACQFRAALNWAFVPSEESKSNLSSKFSGLTGKFPFGVPATVNDWMTLVGGCSNSDEGLTGSGCPEVDLRFKIPHTALGTDNDAEWIIANEGNPSTEVEFMQRLHSARGTLNALVWAAFFGGLAWAVWAWASPLGSLATWGSPGGRGKGGDD